MIDHCQWDNPGVNPYMGTVAAAVSSYKDIPAASQKKLIQMVREGLFTDFVEISSDGTAGAYSNLREMHFGNGVCRAVSMKWPTGHRENALTYCAGGYCIIQPVVCNNISRIDRVMTIEPLTPGSGVFMPIAGIPLAAIPAVPSSESPTVTGEVPSVRFKLNKSIESFPASQYYYVPFTVVSIPAIPEPSTGILALLGIAFLRWIRK